MILHSIGTYTGWVQYVFVGQKASYVGLTNEMRRYLQSIAQPFKK